MKIQILGSGCAKCNALAHAAEEAAQALERPYTLEKVTDVAQITAFGVMRTPALVLDGEVKTMGYVPSADEMKALLAAVR